MSPRPYMQKARAAKAKKASNSKNKKKPEGRPAYSRAYGLCPCCLIVPTLPPKKPDPVRRNPGRMDGATWNGSSFICNSSVDGGTATHDVMDDLNGDLDSDYEWNWDEATPEPRDSRITVSLSDIARPAKPRGVAKEFEMIDSMPRVIAEDDFEDDFELPEVDEDWEEIYGDERDYTLQNLPKKSYSSVAQDYER